MSNKKTQERKKKTRERDSKEKVLTRRAVLRKKAKTQKMIDRIDQDNVSKLMPYVNPEKQKKRTFEQLKHNVKVLKALEEAHDKEAETRKALHDKLESEGHLTFKEKLDALNEGREQDPIMTPDEMEKMMKEIEEQMKE